ncbi:MAG: chemotaxis-specific protein-glutamate methyltransferase CheB [Spirochaetia bacterium]|nr:chemotaxis-specific protein-glutamate methyltransferase CheB [Spirochaetia bacterium]
MSFRVLLVDDSLLVRRAVADIVLAIPDVEVCGEAADGKTGLAMIESLRPDLVIMDIEMPQMDGLTVLSILKDRGVHVPVLILSAATTQGATSTFRALELGALDFVPKPSPDSGLSVADIGEFLAIRVRYLMLFNREQTAPPAAAAPLPPPKKGWEILVIASSTGGPQALYEVFKALPKEFPVPIVIVQHMPAFFTKAFAERLDTVSGLHVREASEGMTFAKGQAVLAPGNHHLLIKRAGRGFSAHLSQAEPVNSHRPSIDVTLENVVDTVGGRAAAVIMTGMGRDGVRGLQRLHDAGGLTLAQDERSSVIFGMNRRAIEAGAIDRVVPLEKLVEVLTDYFGNSG